MKKLILLFCSINILNFTSCTKEYIETEPQVLQKSLFTAEFCRTFHGANIEGIVQEERTDILSFPTQSIVETYDVLRLESDVIAKDGILVNVCKFRSFPFFLDYDSLMYQTGIDLSFTMHMRPVSDQGVISTFSKSEVLDFLQVGKVYDTATDKIGNITVDYLEFAEGFSGLIPLYKSKSMSSRVEVVSLNEYEDKDIDGNLLRTGFIVEVKLEFDGITTSLSYPYEFCTLKKGIVKFFIEYI